MTFSGLAPLQPDTVLDIGANVGAWYREARALWPAARFLLIEGNPACQPAIEETGQDYTMAYLGDVSREAVFYQRKGGSTDTGNSLYRELTPFFTDDQIDILNVHLSRLDEVAGGRVFDMIKIDVQGAELDVMRGGPGTLAAAKWVLLEVALEPYNEGAPLADEVFSFMESIGFTKRENIGDIVHPITQQLIQRDILFSR